MLKILNLILMNSYKLTIEIPAHSKKEAEAKLELLVQLAAFLRILTCGTWLPHLLNISC